MGDPWNQWAFSTRKFVELHIGLHLQDLNTNEFWGKQIVEGKNLNVEKGKVGKKRYKQLFVPRVCLAMMKLGVDAFGSGPSGASKANILRSFLGKKSLAEKVFALPEEELETGSSTLPNRSRTVLFLIGCKRSENLESCSMTTSSSFCFKTNFSQIDLVSSPVIA
jgi:hypothetical protein